MYTLHRHALVPYSARQMFELVNGIEEYPRFLPWCHYSEVKSRSEKEVVALLGVNWKGIQKSFTTTNRLHAFEAIEIKLIDGPMQHLEGKWHFHVLDKQACKVELNLEFEFAGRLIDRLFQPIFQHIANTLVESFCKRAADLYGNS